MFQSTNQMGIRHFLWTSNMCFTHAKTQLCCDAPSFLGSVGKVGSASKVPAASFVTAAPKTLHISPVRQFWVGWLWALKIG